MVDRCDGKYKYSHRLPKLTDRRQIWDLFEGGGFFGRWWMDASTINCILPRWSLSWDRPQRPSSSAVKYANGTGTLKVGVFEISFLASPHQDPSLTSVGRWIAATPLPNQTLESRETRLAGKDKELLLQFTRKILRWLPEERPTAEELLEDEFLTQDEDAL